LTPASQFDAVSRFLAGQPDVRFAYFFGSAARGEERARSDVDIAVLFAEAPTPERLDRFVVDLEAVAERSVDLVVLNSAPPLLCHEIVSTGAPLFCRSEDDRVRFEARTIARYLDTKHLRGVQYAYLREEVEAHRARPR
jgi:uncharacterized protein